MCGHVGMAGDVFSRDIECFKQLLWVDALRGHHNSGAAVVTSGRTVKLSKVEGTSLYLLTDDDFKKSLSTQDKVFIGHNRHATVGSHEASNAHPFEFETLVGAHNGTLSGRSAYQLPDFKTFGTDSEALYSAINEFGADEVIPEIEGAWALVFYSKQDHTINFLRNSERPLSYCFNDKGTILYWASEGWMLRGILSRNGVKLSAQGIMTLNENVLVSFKIPMGNAAFSDPVLKEVKGYERTFFRSGHPMAEILEGWAPEKGTGDTATRHIAPPSPPEASANDLKPKSSSAKPPSDNVVPLVSPGTPATKSPGKVTHSSVMLDKAFELGQNAGLGGRSETQCPYTPRSPLANAWLSGRRIGFEQAMKGAFQPKKTLGPAAIGPGVRKMKGYQGELITEQQFKEMTGCTCSWCDDVAEFGDKLTFFSREGFFCEPCVNADKFNYEFKSILNGG